MEFESWISSQGIAGPHSAMLLAQRRSRRRQGGADYRVGVISSVGLMAKTPHTRSRSTGEKRSIASTLPNHAEAVSAAFDEASDVVIEAFRPGVMAKYGLAYEDAKAENPEIIYLSINGFGSEGP